MFRRQISFAAPCKRSILFFVYSFVVAAICTTTLTGQSGTNPRSSDSARVTGTLPQSGEAIEGRIVVVFDQPIQPLKTVDGAVTVPLTFSPPLEGAYEYGPNFFSFKPGRLLQDTILTATLNRLLRTSDGRPISSGGKPLVFSTFEFKPTNLWLLENKKNELLLAIEFSSRVNVEALRQHLSVNDNKGKTLEFEAQPGTSAYNLRLLIKKLDSPNWPIRLVLKKGMPDSRELLVLPRDFSLEYGRPEEKHLEISAVWGEINRTSQTVRLYFSDAVEEANLSRHLKITDISTTAPKTLQASAKPVSYDNRYYDCTFSAPDPYDLKIRLELPAGILSTAGSELSAAWSREMAVRTDLLIDDVRIDSENREGTIVTINLNHSVDPSELMKSVAIFPKIENLRIVQESGDKFSLHGNWQLKRTYEIHINPGLKFNGWATQRKLVSRSFKTPDELPPYMNIAFSEKYYFPRAPHPALPLETRNIGQVKLVLHRMFPSNIALAPQDITNNENSYDQNKFIKKWSEIVATKQIDLVATGSTLLTTPLKLEKLLPRGMRGVFLLQVQNPRNEDSNLGRYILMTDLGVLTHWTNKELGLFVHDLFTLKPISGARVRVFTNKNQMIGEGETDANGLLLFGKFNTNLGDPTIVLVENGSDYTFLELTPRPEENLPYTDEMPPFDRQKYDAYIYADRSLYRPGDVVHLRWIGRKAYGDALSRVPLLIRIIKPNEKSLLERPVTLSDFGTGELDVPTQKTYPTGTYRADLLVPGENESLASYEFQIEEFVPNRMKATIEVTSAPWIGVTQQHQFSIVARHLFGAPAENRATEAVVSFERGWEPADWRGFQFNNDSAVQLNPISMGQMVTNDSGRAAFQFDWKMPQQVTFPLNLKMLGSVYETGGRKVYASGSVKFFPSPICLGIRGEPLPEKRKVKIQFVAIMPDESPAPLDKVSVTLEQQVWDYSVRDYTTYQEPHWTGEYKELETREVMLRSGTGETVFSAPNYGYYRVRVHSFTSTQYSSLLFYSFGGRCQIAESNEPSLIKLHLNKLRFRVGELAELRVEAPFDGKAVIVIQGEKIRRIITADVRRNVGMAKIKVLAEDFPNAWLEVTVIHPVDKKNPQVYPFASFQMTKLTVDDIARRVQISLPKLPREIQPDQKLTLEVQTRDGSGQPVAAEVTLAAVDEGIHSIKGYENPDPYGHFSRLRRPDFQRAFYYDKVAYDFYQANPGGGEGGYESLGRPSANWIKTIALWSGVVRTDENGRAWITLNVPEFNGELRIVAVAVNQHAVGVTAAPLLVRRPWLLETSMPRFLLPGDVALCRATIYNTSNSVYQSLISWNNSGTLTIHKGDCGVELAGHSEADVLTTVTAGKKVGQGMIDWGAKIIDPATSQVLVNLHEHAPLPVTEPAAYQRREDLIVLSAGQCTTITNTFFLDDDLTRMDLLVGAQPNLRLQSALHNVIDYPYGCVEQTTSKLLPLYLLRKNRTLIDTALSSASLLDTYIEAGIDRLFSMQTASGGLAFWPGGTSDYPYGSIYALHALTILHNGREYEINENNYATLRNYVRVIAMESHGEVSSDLYQRAYAIYVLSLGGDKQALDMIERFDSMNLPTAARYLLAAALARNTRDSDRVKLYLSTAPSFPWSARETDGTLSSEIRNTAVELLAQTQMNAVRAEMQPRANNLTRFLATERYGTTQEHAFVITALCDYLDAVTTDIEHAAATIWANGETTQITGREMFHSMRKGPETKFVVSNTGKTDLFVTISSRGVPAQAVTTATVQDMAVRRQFYTRTGTPLPQLSFRQGESYIVGIEVYSARDARNVVVADLLPAGLEIENPRLVGEIDSGVRLPYAINSPDHLEIRDERLVLFYDQLSACATDLPLQNHHFFYVVNAVTPGDFTYPAVSAECMYDPAVRGASAAGTIHIDPSH